LYIRLFTLRLCKSNNIGLMKSHANQTLQLTGFQTVSSSHCRDSTFSNSAS